MDVIFNGIGIAGMVLFLTAYYLLQRETLSGHDPRYLWLNLIGSVAVLISLSWAFNLAAFMLESAWFAISAYGLIRVWRSPKDITP